jgi:hypothetical protein
VAIPVSLTVPTGDFICLMDDLESMELADDDLEALVEAV